MNIPHLVIQSTIDITFKLTVYFKYGDKMKTSEFLTDSRDTIPFFYIHSLTLRKLELHMPTELSFSKTENNHVEIKADNKSLNKKLIS